LRYTKKKALPILYFYLSTSHLAIFYKNVGSEFRVLLRYRKGEQWRE
jgi:hypothetical protein